MVSEITYDAHERVNSSKIKITGSTDQYFYCYFNGQKVRKIKVNGDLVGNVYGVCYVYIDINFTCKQTTAGPVNNVNVTYNYGTLNSVTLVIDGTALKPNAKVKVQLLDYNLNLKYGGNVLSYTPSDIGKQKTHATKRATIQHSPLILMNEDTWFKLKFIAETGEEYIIDKMPTGLVDTTLGYDSYAYGTTSKVISYILKRLAQYKN